MSRVFTKKRASKPDNGEEGAVVAPLTAEQLWSRVLGWQARREHSRAELEAKLRQIDADPGLIDAALDRLSELGLQSDDRFAESLVRGQLQRGRGQRMIRQTLQQRGIAADHPALAEQTESIDWVEQARQLLTRRFGESLPDEAREKARQVRFLQYRGFSLGQALNAIQSLAAARHEDE